MTTNDESIPAAMTALLDLFGTELAQVRFGELDGAALDTAAGEVREAARELAQAEALAEAARGALEAARERLLQKGQRALAYARIYAEESPELAARLDTIALVCEPRRGEPTASALVEPTARRRGRPPRTASATTPTLALGTAPPHRTNGTSSSAQDEALQNG
jgi:hypothetical protein